MIDEGGCNMFTLENSNTNDINWFYSWVLKNLSKFRHIEWFAFPDFILENYVLLLYHVRCEVKKFCALLKYIFECLFCQYVKLDLQVTFGLCKTLFYCADEGVVRLLFIWYSDPAQLTINLTFFDLNDWLCLHKGKHIAALIMKLLQYLLF